MCAYYDTSLAVSGETSTYVDHRARILIADYHLLVAGALKRLLEPEFQVVGIVPDGRMLIESLDNLRPDVVILEVSMPRLNGLDAGESIKAQNWRVKLVYVTAASSSETAAEAFRRGASGYVLKHDDVEELRGAVRRVLQGRSYVSPLLDKEKIESYLRTTTDSRSSKRLTARQSEILQLIAEGRSMKEIGYMVKIKLATVAFHKYQIMVALGITTTAELIGYAIRHGMIGPRFRTAASPVLETQHATDGPSIARILPQCH